MRFVWGMAVLSVIAITILFNLLQLTTGSPKLESYWSRLEADYLRAWNGQGKVKQPEEYYWLALQTNRVQEAKSVLSTAAPSPNGYDSAYVGQLRKAAHASISAGAPTEAVTCFDTIYGYDLKLRPTDKLLLGRDLNNCGMATYLTAMTIVDPARRAKEVSSADALFARAEVLLIGAPALELLSLAQNRQLVANARNDWHSAEDLQRKADLLRARLPVQAPLIGR